MSAIRYLDIIPGSSSVLETLRATIQSSKIIVLSGLPGVGKSLYVNLLQELIEHDEKSYDIIQWDIARKAFETKEILSIYPMGDGLVHNGLKLIAGRWLMDTIQDWIIKNNDSNRLLIIEAPLVGHRFIELAKQVDDLWLEEYFSSDKMKFIVPIPSKEVRLKIEKARESQISNDAKVWIGAKPSVMLMLWKRTCEIANEFGKNIDVSGQPDYDPKIYAFVFDQILKHRNFVPLHINEVFTIPKQDEKLLHANDSIQANEAIANRYGNWIHKDFASKESIDKVVSNWYKS